MQRLICQSNIVIVPVSQVYLFAILKMSCRNVGMRLLFEQSIHNARSLDWKQFKKIQATGQCIDQNDELCGAALQAHAPVGGADAIGAIEPQPMNLESITHGIGKPDVRIKA